MQKNGGTSFFRTLRSNFMALGGQNYFSITLTLSCRVTHIFIAGTSWPTWRTRGSTRESINKSINVGSMWQSPILAFFPFVEIHFLFFPLLKGFNIKDAENVSYGRCLCNDSILFLQIWCILCQDVITIDTHLNLFDPPTLCQFHQHLMSGFHPRRSQKYKKTVKLSSFLRFYDLRV